MGEGRGTYIESILHRLVSAEHMAAAWDLLKVRRPIAVADDNHRDAFHVRRLYFLAPAKS